MNTAVLSLGSNLGDSAALLDQAVTGLAGRGTQTRVTGISPRARTAPVVGETGPADQPDFLNQIVTVDTGLTPLELLDLAQQLEQLAARTREVRWGPRTLDIDLIAYRVADGDHWTELTLNSERLTLPHPRAHERAFVLAPWAWLDPEATLNGAPVAALAERAADRHGVHRLDGTDS
ncbi:MAG: 2-amino-4-hydroxy-6-hydroxymethyldihydropteridine diphosphokinase [Micrococcaceae bacterium]